MWRAADVENNHFLVVPQPLFAKYFPAESVGAEPTPTGLKGRCSTTVGCQPCLNTHNDTWCHSVPSEQGSVVGMALQLGLQRYFLCS
jgi:hypothetical protein